MTTATHKCVHCKEYFKTETMMSLPIGSVCSDKCIQGILSKRTEKQREQAKKQVERQKKKELRVRDKKWSKDLREYNNRKLSKQHELTQRVFNKLRILEEKLWFKERDIIPYCISCRATHLQFCCGHYSSRGAYSEHAYSRFNTYLQCNYKCNSVKSANKSGDKVSKGYDQGLIERFGEAKAKVIMELCKQSFVKKWTCEELILMRKEFNAEIRRLAALS